MLVHRVLLCCSLLSSAGAWTSSNMARARRAASFDRRESAAGCDLEERVEAELSRREALLTIIAGSIGAFALRAEASMAYTPDPDPQRESLYFISRVQEATVQQERFVNRASKQDELKSKMKLTLRLVEKNYRLLDQINYMSAYVTPSDSVVTATEAGVEAVEALQNAIDYVKDELGAGPFEDGQKEYLTENLRTCREKLFVFLKYMPQEKLLGARKRVEDENVANREEYDGDGTEGVYNPVTLPWKQQ